MAKLLRCIIVLFILTATSNPLFAGKKAFTIIHSNDLHSHFLGFSPNIDYTPHQTGDDETVGGWARIATVIKDIKKNRENPVLVLDAGDFMIGSLFHLLSREKAFELQLMKQMGYDVITLGNHEFDLKPGGLARMLSTAHKQGHIPDIVLSNAIFSSKSKLDDSLEDLFQKRIVKQYIVLEKEGVRFGFFGLMGKDAAEVAPFASPVRFEDPVRAAKRMVKILREKEKADVVICLSHSGLWEDKSRSEDEILAKEVNGIDIIISGHTHTKTEGAIQVNNTIIVQAWEYGKQLGIIDVIYDGNRLSLTDYRLVEIDDSIESNAEIAGRIELFEALINQKVLAEDKLSFRKIIAHTDFDIRIEADESNLGNLIADSIRWYINTKDNINKGAENKVDFSVVSNGVIRDHILKGRTGKISVCDIFRTMPLGTGMDGSMGYPVITFYLYPSEIKKGLEIVTSIFPMKGNNYFLQISGVKFTYNPNRMLFDRVTEIWTGNEEDGYRPLDYSESNKRLYRVAADIYNATFLKVVGDSTWHILNIVPKDKCGNRIDDLKTARVDADKNKKGIQEVKEWKAVVKYLGSFPDITGDGIPDVSEKYRGKLGRNIVEPSWNPYKLLYRGTYVTWICFSVLLILFLMLISTIWLFRRKIRG